MNGTRKLELDIPILIHEEVKKLANEFNITHRSAAMSLMQIGITSYYRAKEARKEKGVQLEGGDGI